MQTNEQMLSAIENYLAQIEFPAEPELHTPRSAIRSPGAANASAPCC